MHRSRVTNTNRSTVLGCPPNRCRHYLHLGLLLQCSRAAQQGLHRLHHDLNRSKRRTTYQWQSWGHLPLQWAGPPYHRLQRG